MKTIQFFKVFILLFSSHCKSTANNSDRSLQVQDLEIWKDLLDSFSLVNLFKHANSKLISETCMTHVTETLKRITSLDFEDGIWPLQMVDAWAKFPAGILRGHTTEIGDFDECLRVKAEMVNYDDPNNSTVEFLGQHCSVELSIVASKLRSEEEDEDKIPAELSAISSFTMGTCFPSTCSNDDIGIILIYISAITKGIFNTTVGLCYTDEKPDFDGPAIAMISILSILGTFVLIGTVCDILLRNVSFQSPSDSTIALNSESTRGKNIGTGLRMLIAFSTYTNIEKCLSTATNSDNLSCLHGLRFLSMCWVILGHTWFSLLFQLNWNLTDIVTMYKDWPMMIILNATFCVDTFFTIAGVLVAYHILKLLDKTNGKFNPFMICLHRYIRLTPAYAIILGVVATLRPYFSTGPAWKIIDAQADYCRRNWWHNLLYINNFMNYDDTADPPNGGCMGETWYLANDMQFFIVATFVVFLMWKKDRIGLGILGLLSVGSIAVPGIVTGVNDLGPTVFPFREDPKYQKLVYIKPWTRAGPYIVGIWTGFLIYKMKQNRVEIPKKFVPIGWLLSTATALALIFGPFNMNDPEYVIGRLEGLIYSSLHRFLWGGVIGWIILSCVTGCGGIVNTILSMPGFIPLGRITFCTYLVSIELQAMYGAMVRQPVVYSVYPMVNLFFSHLAMSCLVGFVMTILLESPFMQLEKIIFRRDTQPK